MLVRLPASALIPLAAALWLAAPSASGQDSVDRRIERFDLFNACRPMRLVVESLHAAAKDIGLTKERLRVAAESRLRAARMYTDSHDAADFSYLYVKVGVTKRAFDIDVSYSKWLSDEFGRSGRAKTWERGSFGTHGGDASRLVFQVSEHLDEFIAAYLRINEASCL